MIAKTQIGFSLPKLRSALEELLSVTTWHGPTGQIALTHAADIPAGANPFQHGTGDKNEPEWHYRHFNDELKGTYFEEVYGAIAEAIPQKVARVRLMRLQPRQCYSYHADDEYRYHGAIWTNPSALVIFEGEPPQHIPDDGMLYGFDARTRHTAVNCGEDQRVHLVVTTG
jgi:hypothetical protein